MMKDVSMQLLNIMELHWIKESLLSFLSIVRAKYVFDTCFVQFV